MDGVPIEKNTFFSCNRSDFRIIIASVIREADAVAG